LVRWDGLYRASVELMAATLGLFEPSLLDIGVWRSVEFLQERAQEMLLLIRLELPNLSFDV